MATAENEFRTGDPEKAAESFTSDVDSRRASTVGRVDEQKLLYKIDRHVLPFICVMYLLAFLDR
jgi:hypothetical protein